MCSQEKDATDAYGSCRNVTGLWPTVPDAPKEGTKPRAGECEMICPCVPSKCFPCVRDPLESVMPAHVCRVAVAVLKPAAVGAVSLPDPVPGAGSTAGALGRAAMAKLVPARPQTGQGGRLSSPPVVSAVSREASRVQGSQGDALCKGKVGTRLYPSHLLSAKELKTDRGTASVRWQPEEEGALLALPREPLSIWK